MSHDTPLKENSYSMPSPSGGAARIAPRPPGSEGLLDGAAPFSFLLAQATTVHLRQEVELPSSRSPKTVTITIVYTIRLARSPFVRKLIFDWIQGTEALKS